MFKSIIKKIKDSLDIKESFLICEEIKFHKIVNEVTNSFTVIRVQKVGRMVINEQLIFSDLKTIGDAEKYLEVYKKALLKERSSGLNVIKEIQNV